MQHIALMVIIKCFNTNEKRHTMLPLQQGNWGTVNSINFKSHKETELNRSQLLWIRDLLPCPQSHPQSVLSLFPTPSRVPSNREQGGGQCVRDPHTLGHLMWQPPRVSSGSHSSRCKFGEWGNFPDADLSLTLWETESCGLNSMLCSPWGSCLI